MLPRSNSKRRLLLLAPLLLLVPLDVLGAQLTPLLQDEELGVRLLDIGLPPSLRKDLVSGLTNRIVIRMVLLKDGRPGAQRLVGIAVKYDLWEETFDVKLTIDDAPLTSQTCRTVDEVVSMLTSLTVPRLMPVSAARDAGNGKLTLVAEILFDPIEKARLEEIRKWVAENDRPIPPDPTSVSSGLPARPSTSSRVFNRIFEQYAAGASVAAAWKETVSSAPFRLQELRNGP
jgi:hypothetical protein